MSVDDYEVKSVVYNYFVPVILFVLSFPLLLTILKFLKPRGIAWFSNVICKRIHAKFSQEKDTLFRPSLLSEAKLQLGAQSQKKLNILEIGAGSGLNFKYYPDGSVITCLDPNRHHEKYIIKNLESLNPKVELKEFVCGFGEDMSCFKNEQFDVVTETLVLCSVTDPQMVLKEVLRVLKPGGKFYFIDHVAADKSTWLFFFQNKLNSIWQVIADNCNINRDISSCMKTAGFTNYQMTSFKLRTKMIFLRPCIYGIATK